MNYCAINGKSYDVIVTAIEESFSILYTENTGRTLGIGAPMTLDPLGCFFSHKVTFKRCKENAKEFLDSLPRQAGLREIQTTTQPLSFRTVLLSPISAL